MDELALADLEERTRHAVAGSLRAALVALEREVVGVYLAVAGDTRHALTDYAQATIRRRLVDALTGLIGYDYADTRSVLTAAARTALVGGAEDLGAVIDTRLPLDVRQAFTALTANMRHDLRDALRLAKHGPMRRYGEILSVIATARKALNHADSTAVWVVHRAHNEGRSRGIDRVAGGGGQVLLLWRAERDACVYCLSLAGALTEPGEPFRPVVAVADRSQVPDHPVLAPPAHPWCRCALEPWFGAAEADLTPLDLPHALRREAQRSLASGQAQASQAYRLRAAHRLLDLGNLLIPKTVQKRARKSLATGAFPS